MKYLLDGGTLAAALKGRLPVVLRLSELAPGQVALSVFARLQVEIGLRQQPRAQARYAKLMREFCQRLQLIEFGDAEARQAATLGSYLTAKGESIGAVELLLAAQAVAHRCTLVTEDVRPYRMVAGLNVENWLDPESEVLSRKTRKQWHEQNH